MGIASLHPPCVIFADRSPRTAHGLLLFGFIVTFGSAAMGSAIMAMGQREEDEDESRGGRRLVVQEIGQAAAKWFASSASHKE
jgi:hypothetical protein